MTADTAVCSLRAISTDITLSTEFERWIAVLFGDPGRLPFAVGDTVDDAVAVAPAARRLANDLEAISAGDIALSQRRFWRFVNEVNRGYQRSTGGPGRIVLSCSLSPNELCSGISEGQGRHSDLRAILNDLSRGDIRAILGSVADEIKVTAGAGSAIAFVLGIRQRLFREIERRAVKRAFLAPLQVEVGLPSGRDQIIAFRLHTGNSPPTSAASRPAVGRALFNTVARKVANETICRRPTRTDLSHSLRCRTAEARRYHRARGRQPLGCFAQPAGCRRRWSDYPLEQAA